MFRRTSAGARFETVAAAWGGLVPAIALIVTSTQTEVVRLAIAIVAFAVGGFLCGIRADNRRALHGAVAALIGIGMYVAFIALTHAADLLGLGPDPFSLEPADPRGMTVLVVVGVITSSLAAAFVASRLSSGGTTRIGT